MVASPLQRWGVLLASAMVAIVVCACGSTASSPTSSTSTLGPIRVQVSPGAITDMLDFVAMDAGFFSKNHLNVQFVDVAAAPGAMTALAANSVDVIAVSPEVPLEAVAKGFQMQVIAGQAKVIWELVVNNTITTTDPWPQAAQSLAGKKFGVVQLGTPGQFLTEALLKDAGVAPSNVTFLAVGTPSGAIAALEHNEIQATLVNEPTPEAIKLANAGRTILDLRNGTAGPAYLAGQDEVMDWAQTSFVKTHPQEIAAFRKALAQTDVWMHDPSNLNAVESIYAKEIGTAVIPTSDMPTFVKENLGTATAHASSDSLSAWIAFSVQYGIIPAPINLSSVLAAGTPQNQSDIQRLAA